MTVYSRTFGRVASVVAMPRWRQAMTNVDTLYNVSAHPPAQANPKLVWPHGIVRPWGYHGDENEGRELVGGYSSGVLLEDVGAFGTMVYGSGGHTQFRNQLLSLSISDDAPKFDWFQQPYFEVSDINGAEVYYNYGQFQALPDTQKTGTDWNTEGTRTKAWLAAGGKFPMGYMGWIYPRKLVTGQLGRNNPHGFRYATPSYIPPSLTGGDAGAYVVVEGPQGPFSQSWFPIGATSISQLVDASALWPSGRRKWPVWVKNVKTGDWKSLNGFQPDYWPWGFVRQHTAVAVDQKRVYVSVDIAMGTSAWWYIDFTNGIEGAVISDVIRPRTEIGPNRYTTGALVTLNGRHLWYWPNVLNTAGFCVQDLDNDTQFNVNLGKGLHIPTGTEQVGMQFDAPNQRILIILTDGTNIKYRSVTLPTDPRNAAGYYVSQERVVGRDVSVQKVPIQTHFYGKTRYLAQLGVMFVPQSSGPMLAFRPAA